MSKIELIAEQIAEPIAAELGLELVDVEFKKEGKDWFLRLFIDKEGGIVIDDCEALSRRFEDEIDKTDPIEQAYYLEVSSPGIDRQLKKDKEFIKYLLRKVDIKMYKPLNGKKEFTGILAEYADGVVTIDLGEEKISFNKSEAAWIKLAVEF